MSTVSTQAAIYGGATPVSFVTAGSNNATALKTSEGRLYGVWGYNVAAYPIYIKFYNKATAADPNTDTAVLVLMVPANATAALGGANNAPLEVGAQFPLGISYAVVKGITATDNTAVVAADGVFSILYK